MVGVDEVDGWVVSVLWWFLRFYDFFLCIPDLLLFASSTLYSFHVGDVSAAYLGVRFPM